MTAAAREIFDQGVLLENGGELAKAAPYFVRASEMLPQDLEIAYRAASAHLRLGKLEDAQSRLRRIVFSDPGHLNARCSLANCQLLLEDYDLAESNFRDVLDQIPDNKNALYGLANLLLNRNGAVKALPLAQKLLDLMPQSLAALVLLGDCQQQVGQGTQAVATYRKVLKRAPDHPPALIGLSKTLLKAKRFDEVVALAVRAAERIPDSVDAFDMLSQALEARGDHEDALEAGREALRLKSGDAKLLVRLSALSRKLGSYPSALRYALDAHDLDPDSREPFNALGTALAALKHPKEARMVLTGGVSQDLDPEVRTLAENLAAVKTPDVANQVREAKPMGQTPSESITPSEISEDSRPPASADTDASPSTRQTGPSTMTNPGFGAGGDDPLPNVLGLTRRDVS